jgi:hypothetical protein
MTPAAARAQCYTRAHECGDREGIALNKLGRLYDQASARPARRPLASLASCPPWFAIVVENRGLVCDCG